LSWQLERGAGGECDNSGDVDDKKFEIESGQANLPLKCCICKNNFTNPVVTRYALLTYYCSILMLY